MRILIAALVIVLLPGAARAARIISIDIERDGKPALHGEWADDGFAGKYTVWRYLNLVALHAAPGFKISDDKGLAILKGDIAGVP